MAKKFIVIGNWKMHKTNSEAVQFIEQLKKHNKGLKRFVGLAVPYTSIEACVKAAGKSGIRIGAQNMNNAEKGAFTGEVAGKMLHACGASFVLVGHSERRIHFHEDNAFINAKVQRALKDNLQPVLCVGETEEQREEDYTQVLESQIEEGLQDVTAEDAENLLIAYEPVWAIGTGKTATPKMAEEAHKHCRKCLQKLFGAKVAKKIPILYGGSVKPETTAKLAEQANIDGVLVGGASLEVKTFNAIIHFEKD